LRLRGFEQQIEELTGRLAKFGITIAKLSAESNHLIG